MRDPADRSSDTPDTATINHPALAGGLGPPMPRTTVVTVTYNSAETIGPMLESLRPAHAAGLVEIVIVDNASKDATLAALAPYEREGLVRLVHAEGNTGFGRGCNLGASHATTDFVLFLNPDARMDAVSIGALEAALDADPAAAVAAPAIERPDHTIQPIGMLPTGLSLIFERTRLHRVFLRPQRLERDQPSVRTRWVSGAVFMVCRETFNSLGGFDPRFFLYYEESDLFRRLLRRGHHILATGQAICHHIGGHSADSVQAGRIAGSIAEHFIRSRNYYARKHFGPVVMWLADAAFYTTLMLRGTLTCNPHDRATWKARKAFGLFVMPEHASSAPLPAVAAQPATQPAQQAA